MTLVVQRHRIGAASIQERRSPAGGRERKSGPVVNVALVNNMPDKALAATEQQFRRLLRIASGDRIVRLHCFSLPSVKRSTEAQRSIEGVYRQIADLDRLEISGLLVTGAEPVAASPSEEPFWPALTELMDWARDNTVSTIWSCLAAHAAVLRLDGLERRRLATKCSGVFACGMRRPHWMLETVATSLEISHSRLNALDAADLAGRGYDILTSSEEAGVDVFARTVGGSEFIFFQGHPEYAASALKHEFVRDLRRYLAGTADIAPLPPAHYFDEETERALGVFMAGIGRDRHAGQLASLPRLNLRASVPATVQRAGEILIRNWVHHLFEHTGTGSPRV